MLLVGDIGGTKTELAVYASVTALTTPVANDIFPSKNYHGLEEIVCEFLAKHHVHVERAAFGVAGPVVANKATITNLPWIVETEKLKADLHLHSVLLMNDLESIASAVPFLRASELATLNHGQSATNGPLAVIAPGTGLGEAFLTWGGQNYIAHMSEGGHADFAPTDELQIGLLRYLQPRLEHVSYEWVCSGRGIPNIYAYLKESNYAPEPSWLTAQLAQVKDPNSVIAQAALDKTAPDPLCVATIKTFVSILAAEAGNLALKILSTGGLYIGGGVPRHILPFLQEESFMKTFLDKGRLVEALKPMPVHIILNAKVGLHGAAYRGFALEW
ncbi:MAG: glucokinase [Ktedonobacteraceae bacterium]